MNWFEFAPGREGMVVETERTESAGGTASNASRAAAAAARELPVRPGAEPAPAVAHDAAENGAEVSTGPALPALLAALAATGALPAGLAPRVEEVLRELAVRHPGDLRVVDAVSTGGANGAALVLVVERQSSPDLSVESVAIRFGLTHRQATVAILLARRHSNAEIARMLAVSPHTARHHTERVLERLGVSSRMDVAALLLAD